MGFYTRVMLTSLAVSLILLQAFLIPFMKTEEDNRE